MAIELNKLDKYYDVRKHAIRTKYWLERKPLTREGERSEIFARHLKDAIKHPTSGMLAYQSLMAEGFKDEELYNRNVDFMLNDEKMQKLLHKLKALIKHWYPQTRTTRRFIMKTGRVAFDEVRPVKHDLEWFKFKISKMLGFE